MILSHKVITAALCLITLLSSCASAPDSELIAPKNNDRLIEEAKNTTDESRKKLSDLKGEEYSFTFTSPDGNVKVSADAQVYLPEADTVPMYHIESSTFSQEQATAAYDYLFAGKKTWYYPDGSSFEKADADQWIADLERDNEQIKNDPDMDEEEKERRIAANEVQIKDIRDNYDGLPDHVEKIPNNGAEYFDSTISTVDGEQTYRCLLANTDDGQHMEIRNFGDFADSNSQFLYYTAKGDQYIVLDGDVDKSTCKYSPDDAYSLASGLLDKMGVENQVVWTGIACSEFTEEGEPLTNDAYAFYFTRVIDGVPVATTTSNLIYHNDTAKPWLYEKILICVNDDGIAYVNWECPVEKKEIVSEDVHIVPFSSAAEIFEQMAPLIWQGNLVETMKTSLYDTKYDIKVERIGLELVRVRDSGGLSGLYTPAYVFYGKETTIRTDPRNGSVFEDTEDEPWIIMAINAVDLSIIDIIAGD